MGRTGLILRQWVERNGCIVTAYQSEAYDAGHVTTAVIDHLRTFVFPNEWRAKLCEARMRVYDWNRRKKNWLRYFERHIDPPVVEEQYSFNLWFLLRPDIVFTILGILIIWCAYHKGW